MSPLLLHLFVVIFASFLSLFENIEWAKDGNSNEIFIVQARPETVQSQKNHNILVTYVLKGKKKENKEAAEKATKVLE